MDKKTLETILYIVFILFIINGSTYITNWLGKEFYESEFRVNSVFDLFHEYTPDFHKFEFLINIIPFAILGCLFFCGLPLDSIKEFAWKLLLIYVIRALTVITTILPKHEKCNYEISTFSLTTFLGGCYDKVFSGHMALTLLGTLIYYREKYISFSSFALINIVEAVLIILTRAHYTIDVFLAILITYLVYDGDYHIFTDFAKKLKV
jgi:hypothetical protein